MRPESRPRKPRPCPSSCRIALRYLTARRKQAFISVISAISVLGVVVGVMALMVALGLMTGLQREIRSQDPGRHRPPQHLPQRQRALRRTTARWWTQVRKVPRVLGAAPTVYGKGLMLTAGGSAVATLKGVVPAEERTVTDLARPGGGRARSTRSTSVAEGGLPPDPARPRSREHASGSGVGDVCHVTSPHGRLSPDGHAAAGDEVPRGGHRAQRPLRVRRAVGLHPAGRGPAPLHRRQRPRVAGGGADRRHLRGARGGARASWPRWARATSRRTGS